MILLSLCIRSFVHHKGHVESRSADMQQPKPAWPPSADMAKAMVAPVTLADRQGRQI